MTDVLPGCEPYSANGGPDGVLVLHGFTGNPSSMRPLAERLAGDGFSVELPRWPGHGTTIEDCLTTDWSDWSGASLAAYDALAARCAKVAVVGLSVGGGVTALIAQERSPVACVFINAMIKPPAPELVDMVDQIMADGTLTFATGNGQDVKKEGVVENAYAEWPLPCLKSLFESLPAVGARLGEIAAPSLVITSREDHTVTPDNSEDLVAALAGPVEHVWLDDSYHVATIDNDQALVEDLTSAFLQRAFAR